MITIAGVDFSGAKKQVGKTCVAYGSLLEDSGLWLDGVHPTTREGLYQWIEQLPPPAVVAMDFPFGVPAAFAHYLGTDVQQSKMPDVWEVVADWDWDDFMAARDAFVGAWGVPKRYCDALYFPGAFPPLASAPNNMVPMTYRGICMLQRLHQNYPQRWYVPPLSPPGGAESQRVTLMEVMPGATLKAIGLPHRGFKSGANMMANRHKVLAGLAAKSGVPLPNLDTVWDTCLGNDDCLDAVVAAVCAAAWRLKRPHFRHPANDTELAYAQLEGCIYTLLPE